MSYRENIKHKVEELPEGSEQRAKLWERVCDAYERGGEPEIATELDQDVAEIEKAIREALKSIEGLL